MVQALPVPAVVLVLLVLVLVAALALLVTISRRGSLFARRGTCRASRVSLR